jgi:hypothetical protein
MNYYITDSSAWRHLKSKYDEIFIAQHNATNSEEEREVLEVSAPPQKPVSFLGVC